MTLNDDPTKPPTHEDPSTQQPQQLERKQKKTSRYPPKLSKAIEIAKKYPDLAYAAAKNKIQEETPCSKSVAHKAYRLVHDKIVSDNEATQEKTAGINILSESDAHPEFLEKPTLPKEELEPDELTSEATPTLQLNSEQQEQLDLFKDMLRGTYVMVFSTEGILGQKYGRTVKQCENLADMQYRWLIRRYDVNDLAKFDTILLVGAYGTMFAGIAKDYMAERKKKQAEKRAE